MAVAVRAKRAVQPSFIGHDSLQGLSRQDADATEYALRSVAHFYEGTWMDTLESFRAPGKVLLKIGETIRECPNNYNRDFALG
jgi:hypothetical protein